MARSAIVTVTSDLSGAEITDGEAQSLTIPAVVTDEDGTKRLTYVKFSFDASDSEVMAFVEGMYSDDSDVLFANENIHSAECGKRSSVAVNRNTDEDLSAIREWARANGHQVADKGRIKGEVKEAYYAANKTA